MYVSCIYFAFSWLEYSQQFLKKSLGSVIRTQTTGDHGYHGNLLSVLFVTILYKLFLVQVRKQWSKCLQRPTDSLSAAYCSWERASMLCAQILGGTGFYGSHWHRFFYPSTSLMGATFILFPGPTFYPSLDWDCQITCTEAARLCSLDFEPPAQRPG